MANMSWNSAMNIAGDAARMLTDKDPATGEYRIPHIIYSDAYSSEMVAYADLVLPDTTYLERWDCISLLDRPICSADAPADAIRQPVVAPDRDVRPFQDVLIELGARLGLPGFVDRDGAPRYPGGYADYIVNHERTPGHRPARRLARRGRQRATAAARPTRTSSSAYIENGCFHAHRARAGAALLQARQHGLSRLGRERGLHRRGGADHVPALFEPLQKFRLAARGHGAVQPPASQRERIANYFDPLPFWYAPFEARRRRRRVSVHAITQRPMHMYHSWGSQNAWLRQITARTASTCTATRARALGLADGDWVWIESAHRPRQGPRPADGRRQPRHGVDLERDRQARRRLGARRPTRRRRRAASCSTT